MGESGESSLVTLIITNLAVAVILGFSMKYVWQLINSLQLITHLMLFRGLYPSNYLYFVYFMFTITNLEFIPTETIYNELNLFSSSSFSN